MALSWRTAVLIACGIFLLIFSPTLSTAWGWIFLSLTLALIDAVCALSPREFRIERHVNDNIRADQSTTCDLWIENPTRRGATLTIRDAWPPSMQPTPSHHHIRLAAHDRVRVTTVLSPKQRGTRRCDRITIRVWGPLGLAARQVSLSAPASIAVLPEFRARKLLPSRLARLHELEGSTAVVLRGPGTEFDSLRTYVRGDDPRDIDWRASARSQDLIVRTWRPERDRHVVIIVDCGRSGALLLGAPEHSSNADALDLGVAPRMDASIEAALLLATLADRAGDHVHFLAMDRSVRARVDGVQGPALLRQCGLSLADISPSLLPMDWQRLITEVRRTVHHKSLVVLCTDLPPAGTDPQLYEAVALLTRTHTVIVASAQDPTILRMAQSHDQHKKHAHTADHYEMSPDTPPPTTDVYDVIAAHAALRETRAGAHELQRTGAIVITTDAGLLAAHLSDTYLALKKSGRL
ncbi:DUF58 domain-containing protein [Schaalia sp. lx-260]|uniref:DUF58 domain-containing protein n=1 Tax=Schaalia sp. lx-260 TaxID=2899082 RepID=UPI001E4925DE|nr:DUF58 domain-containing protein [Schaalia sp. lx-260]MCD4549731.1 DUF58 domain-containing protein [Schaalia sp. lx-260]